MMAAISQKQQETIKAAEAKCMSTYEAFRLASRKANNEDALLIAYRAWHDACRAKRVLLRALEA